jgi:hypothetical protein
MNEPRIKFTKRRHKLRRMLTFTFLIKLLMPKNKYVNIK